MRWIRFYTCWTFILGWTALFLVVNCDLLIIRKVNKKDTYHKDRFNIQRSKCTDIRQGNKCGVYGGFERSPNNPCKCHCPPRRGTISLQNNEWRCRSNQALRQREGCGFYLLYESNDSFVKMVVANKWQFFNAPNSRCSLSNAKTSYLSCKGLWIQIPNMAKHVDVIMQGFDPVARGYAYKIRIKKKLHLLAGKMIKLYLNCTPFGGNPCLLVKMRGNQNCFTGRGSKRSKKIKKKNTKFARVLSLPSPSMVNKISSSIPGRQPVYNSTLFKRRQEMIEKNNGSEILADNWTPKAVNDRKITTLILTFTAIFLGLVVLGLAINLCFCSTNQESQKGKHIFRRAGMKGGSRLRASSDTTTTSHTLSLSLEISSKKSETFPSSIYETENGVFFVDGESYSNPLSRHEGVS